MKHFYGWKPSPPEPRDFKYHPAPQVLAALPPSVDLSSELPPVLDQGSLGSCGPNAIDGMIEMEQAEQHLGQESVSRLFTYYNTRILMGTVDQDSGVYNRDMLKALAKYGFCPETLWPYNTRRFTEKPPPSAYNAALANRISDYAAVEQTLSQMQGTLAAGEPILFGFLVFESFESDAVTRTGDVPMPGPGEAVLGGHDVLLYGYNDASGRFLFRNSWGNWGNGGNGTFPYAFCTDPRYASDFWVINAIPGGSVTVPSRLQLARAMPKGATPLYNAARQQIGTFRGADHVTPKWIYELVPEPAAAQQERQGVQAMALGHGRLRALLTKIAALIAAHGDLARPLIEELLAHVPLTALEREIVNLLVDVLLHPHEGV